MRLPFDWAAKPLEPEDLVTFEPHFGAIIQELFNCQTVHLVSSRQFADPASAAAVPDRYVAGVVKAHDSGLPAVDAESPILYLPVRADDTLLGVAVLCGGDGSLYERPVNWLAERSLQMVREFMLIKKLGVDPVTGLGSGRIFFEALQRRLAQATVGEAGAGDGEFALFLVEIYPRVRESRQSLLYLSRAGSQLNSLVGQYAPVYHLGAGLFGLLWQVPDNEHAIKAGSAVLDWLKREQIVRVHIGIAMGGCAASPPERAAGLLLEQAWSALEKARLRGPYGLCTYTDPDTLDPFSVKQFPAKVLAALKKLWRPREAFALLLCQIDGEGGDSASLAELAGDDVLLPFERGRAFVVLPGVDAAGAKAWADGFAQRVMQATGRTLSMGIALYPSQEYRKADMPVNARKALAHTAFFGPGSRTLFDAVSLNISGDVYYNDGYLAKAVKEYKSGLELDGANTNLLNSLGVAYGQTNRHQAAIPLFERVLALDAGNFMALCNLGFSQLALGRKAEAIDCFERALVVDDSHFDLLLQLGRLYCQTRQFDKAVDVLGRAESSHDEHQMDIGFGAVHRYLGEAHKEMGRLKNAMGNLQRAMRHNPRDAAAMSLLGEVYALADQGGEIALSLCRQAVELDDSTRENWYRLGKVQFHLGHGAAAITSLKESLRLDPKDPGAAFLLARVYEVLGMHRHARRMFERVLEHDPGHVDAAAALTGLRKRRSGAGA